jgi:hypothetical protein
MLHRRAVLTLIASTGAIGASQIALAKEKHHLNGNALLGAKIKQNGKHKIHTAGKADVFADVSNGKVVGVSAAGMQVKKVRTRQKLAQSQTIPELMLASMQVAQADVYYYGYWVYDPVADYYYWFTSDVVVVDSTWVEYVPS